MNAITIDTHSISEDQFTDTTWLRYFDIKKALAGLDAHIGGLTSDKTPEQYTRKTYERGIWYFIKWAGGLAMKLPTPQLLTEFIRHLRHEKEWVRGNIVQYGISSATVSNGYLAPVRIFLRHLADAHQTIHGIERQYIYDWRAKIIAAANVDNPSPDTKTNIAPLWNRDFTRLNINQVNEVLTAIDRDTIIGSRDYALMRLMFESALRIAEIRRIKPASITPEDDHYLITVRGKRSNIDPVAISPDCFDAIQAYITRYNAPLDDDDPRRINKDTPLFQALRKGDLHRTLKSRTTGLGETAIRNLIAKRTTDVLGPGLACSPHDCRRTFAYIAFTQGMPLTEISKALRHSDASITWRYIGAQPDYTDTLLTNYVKFA